MFDCDAGILVRLQTVNADGSLSTDDAGAPDVAMGDAGFSCTPAGTMSLTDSGMASLNLTDSQYLTFTIRSSALVASETGIVTYRNTAEITSDDVTVTPDKTIESSYFGASVTGDGITIIKRDEVGHDAQDGTDPIDLTDANGETGLVFAIRNSGTTTLTDITVSEAVTAGSGTVSNLSCVFPDKSTGTTWAGPFEPRDTFQCTADLSGVVGERRDLASVTATGNGTVDDDDEYNATTDTAVSIGDFVWYDADADGVQDDGETPASGVTVTLYEGDGTTEVASTTTDANGFSSFTDLTVSTDYVVVFPLRMGTCSRRRRRVLTLRRIRIRVLTVWLRSRRPLRA